MKRNAIKMISASVVLAMMLGMTSCSNIQDLLGGKEEKSKKGDSDEAIEEVEALMTEYMDYVVKGKFDKAAKLVDGGESLFDELALTVEQEEYLDVLTSNTEYEIADVDAKAEKSGECTVTITTVDLEAYYNDEDDTVEEEFSIKFTYDDGWLIKDASDIEDFYIDTVINAEISSVSTDDAEAYFVSLLDLMCSGDLETAFNLTRDDGSIYVDYEDYIANTAESSWEIIGLIFSNATYEYELTEVGDDYMNFDVTLTMPQVQQVLDNMYPQEMIDTFFAYELFAPDQLDSIDADAMMMDSMTAAIPNVDTVTNTYTYKLSFDEDGNYAVALVGDFTEFDNLNAPTLDSIVGDDYYGAMLSGCDYALEIGLCTQEEYDAMVTMIEGMETGENAAPTENLIQVVEGSDCYLFRFTVDDGFDYEAQEIAAGSTGFYIECVTFASYPIDSAMECAVYFNGDYVGTMTYTSTVDETDHAYFAIEPDGGVQVGTYTFEITGYNGESFGTGIVMVAE